jgi:cyclopropane fatty-acyl-phospholipid synthase-like methyltransferase
MTIDLDHWQDVPRDCAQTVPGVGHGNERVMDLSQRGTTADQLRIEAALEELLPAGACLLHVGIGNSSLAGRFAARCGRIVGLALSSAEQRHGDSLAIAGYSIRMLNKYSADLDALDGAFDFIVDNNLSSFGCCIRHFELMLASYARLLRPGGLILTDRVGMQWTYRNGPMQLRFEDLEAIARSFPFTAQRISGDVFALRRRADR